MFEVGSKATVMWGSSNAGVSAIHTVTAVSARIITLSDSSKWSVRSHRPIGKDKERFYSGPILMEWKQEHSDALKLGRLRSRVTNVKWDEMPLEVLEKVLALLPAKPTP